MIKRTVHIRDNADECLKAIYMTMLKDNVKGSNYSRIISDALEYYFDAIKNLNGKEIENCSYTEGSTIKCDKCNRPPCYMCN